MPTRMQTNAAPWRRQVNADERDLTLDVGSRGLKGLGIEAKLAIQRRRDRARADHIHAHTARHQLGRQGLRAVWHASLAWRLLASGHFQLFA